MPATAQHPTTIVRNASPSYRPELDGLRGIAILAVVVNHLDERLLPGGYVGVDVFFVLSGYLITSLVSKDIANGTFRLANFFARRIRRIVPAAAALVAGCMGCGFFLLLPVDFRGLGSAVAASSTMLANVLFYRRQGYFQEQLGISPLLHTWSLSVEEQFYLAYPLVLLLLTGIGRRWRFATLTFLATLWLAFSVHLSASSPSAAFYLIPTRAWELLVGGLCASCTSLTINSRLAAAGSLASMLGIGGACALFSAATPFPGIAAALPVISTAGFIVLTLRPHRIATLLGWRPLRFLGQISYSLYLWHWPMLIFFRYPWSADPGTCPSSIKWVAVGLSFAAAAVSYRMIETPFRRREFSDRATLLGGAAVSALLAVTGVAMHFCQGLPQRLPAAVARYAAGSSDVSALQHKTIGLTAADVRSGKRALIGNSASHGEADLLLWGDSHADMYVPVLDDLGKQAGLSVSVFTKGITPPLPFTLLRNPKTYKIKYEFTDAVAEALRAGAPPNVILVARWSVYLKWGMTADAAFPTTSEEKTAALVRALSGTISLLRDAGTKKVWIVRELPHQRYDVPRALAFAELFGGPAPVAKSAEEYLADMKLADAALKEVAAGDVEVLDFSPTYFRLPNPLLTPDDRPMYSDGNHLSATGCMVLREEFASLFGDIAVGLAEE